MRARLVAIVGLMVLCLSLQAVEGKSKKAKQLLSLQSKETNVVNFTRLVLMRLIFGVASAMGLGENISDVLGGVFVPPGADDYDYGDDDLVPGFF